MVSSLSPILVIVVSFPTVVSLPNGSLQAAGVTTTFVRGLAPISALVLTVSCSVPCGCGMKGVEEGMVGSGKSLMRQCLWLM